MIQLQNLTRRFDTLAAVDDLTVTIPSGRIVALLGANGAGKTTTLNMLTTLLAPTSGTATVGGYDIITQGQDVRRVLGYVPEHGALYEGLTADEYLELAGRNHPPGHGVSGIFRGGRLPRQSPRHIQQGYAAQGVSVGRASASAGNPVPGRAHGRPGCP